MSRLPIITIDGMSATGKGTLAESLAKELGFVHLDTGAQYRAVALNLLNSGKEFSKERAIESAEAITPPLLMALIQNPKLRHPETSVLSAKVARIPAVRTIVTNLSKTFCRNLPVGTKGAILDGRDAGLLVMPDADLKFYLEADVKVTAKRRWLEYQQRGVQKDFQKVLEDTIARDESDRNNPHIPKPTPDMIHLDTSDLNKKQVFEKALKIIRERL